jgi:LysR family glycine cleavage system transcriptional activator
MRRLPPLAAVRVFEAAARHENFTKAAAELGLTQAAVSYQIKLLEERLGAPLFLRSKRRVTLSEAGRKAAPIVSAAFDSIGDAFAGLRAENEAVLTITAAETFAANWLAPRLGSFQFSHPHLAVRLTADARLVDFAREEIDVGIRTAKAPWPGLLSHFLYRQHFTPLCSPAFLERTGGLAGPSALIDAPRLSPDDIWWKIWFETAGVEAPGGSGLPGIRLDSGAMEGNVALAGHGVAILTPCLWRNEIASGRLVQPFPLIAYDGTSQWVVYPELKRNLPKVRAFRDWALAEAERMAATEPASIFDPPK